jgi:restriction system protein
MLLFKKEGKKLKNALKFIKDHKIPIVKIETDRNYWLIRTNSGDFFEEFFLGNFIGINWNEFSNPKAFTEENKEATTFKLAETYKDNKQPGHIFGQIKRFFHELKIGDIVMIPSKDSKHIGFGIITSGVYLTKKSQTEIDEGECPYEKRRNVDWVKTVDRKKLDPYLYKMMHTHLTISNANDYADAIDRTMYSFYYKGDKAHLVLNVKQEKDIALIDLLNALKTPLDLVEIIKNPLNPNKDFNKGDLDAKLRVQSPGVIEFVSSGQAFLLVAVLGIVMVGIVGGKFTFKANKERVEGEISSEGLFEKIIKLRKQTIDKNAADSRLDKDCETKMMSLEEFKRLESQLIAAKQKLQMETPEVIDQFVDSNLDNKK